MPSLIKGKQIVADSLTNREIDTATDTVTTINAGDAAVSGASTAIANKTHQHAVATGGATSTIQPDDVAAEGASSNLAREDHAHAIVTAAPSQGVGGGNTEGASTSFARADHDHTIRTTSGPTDLTVGAIADGQLVERSGTALVGITEIDDTQHGNRSGGSLHSTATTGTAGFMSAADKTKLDSLQDAAGIDAKESVKVATTAAGTLTTDFENGDTVDGVVLTTGDRLLIKNQASGVENGIYTVNATGAPTRTADLPSGEEARGTTVAVEEGTTNGDSLWLCTVDEGADVVGTDALTFAQIGSGSPRSAGAGLVLNGNDLDVVSLNAAISVNADDIEFVALQDDTMHGNRGGGALHADVVAAGASGFMTGADKTKLDGVETAATAETFQQELVTTENITGTDTALTDTLDNSPKSVASVKLFLNGIQQIQGAGQDYTISGATITWLASSGTAVDMETTDSLVAAYVS